MLAYPETEDNAARIRRGDLQIRVLFQRLEGWGGVEGLGLSAEGLELRVWGVGLRVWGSSFRVQGLGCRV